MKKPVQNKRAIITSGYGVRTLPDGKKEMHGGLDIAIPGNPDHVPIYSTYTGEVTAIIYDEKVSCGKAVFIRPKGKDFYCLFFHLAYVNPDLAVGDVLEEGSYLGAMGNTGFSRGVHLHYGHRKGMESGTETIEPIDIREAYK